MGATVINAVWGTMARRIATVIIFAILFTGFGYSMGTQSKSRYQAKKMQMNHLKKGDQKQKLAFSTKAKNRNKAKNKKKFSGKNKKNKFQGKGQAKKQFKKKNQGNKGKRKRSKNQRN